MNSKRLELLKMFVEEDPEEPFNWYAIAMEYSRDAPEQAFKLLTDVLKKFPDYLPAYYQCGLLAIQFSGVDGGLAILEKGIQLARKQNDLKTLHELNNLKNQLLDE